VRRSQKSYSLNPVNYTVFTVTSVSRIIAILLAKMVLKVLSIKKN
jgi:hypothetical protein